MLLLILHLGLPSVMYATTFDNRSDAGANCPAGCMCYMGISELRVNCTVRSSSILVGDPDKLSSEMDRLLSSNATFQPDLLTSLRIFNSSLTTLPTSVCRLKQLRMLHIDHNKLIILPDNCFHGLINLEELTASENKITELQDGLFDGLDKLRKIMLRDNRIESIGFKTFSNSSTLINLRLIDLGSNLLTSLEPWPMIRGTAPGAGVDDPVTIDIDFNYVSTFTNTIGWHYDCMSPTPYVWLRLTSNLVRHIRDATRGWGIDNSEVQLCLSRNKLNPWWLVLDRDGFVCDCQDFEYHRMALFFPFKNMMNNVMCDMPLDLHNQMFLRVSADRLVCDITERCPPGCSCIYRPANSTMHVNCRGSNVSSVPSQLPPLPKTHVSYKIDMSGVVTMRRIEARPLLENVSVFDISDSAVEAIDDDAWLYLARMKRVNLEGNMLKFIPETVKHINFSQSLKLGLGRNPWSCSCDDWWFVGWLKSVVNRLPNPDEILCETPSSFAGKNILRLTEDEMCNDGVVSNVSNHIIIAVLILLAISVLMLAIIVATFILYRRRVAVYTRWKLHPFDGDECYGENVDFDLFLCCCYADHETTGRPLIEQLEEHNYHVCYHLRDFPIGEMIVESIGNTVERSKRIVCVLTENFIGSAYCMYEFELGLHHVMSINRCSRLIVLMMLDSPSEIVDDATTTSSDSLRRYLRHHTYVDCRSDSDWFDKLLYALPVSSMLPRSSNAPENLSLLRVHDRVST